MNNSLGFLILINKNLFIFFPPKFDLFWRIKMNQWSVLCDEGVWDVWHWGDNSHLIAFNSSTKWRYNSDSTCLAQVLQYSLKRCNFVGFFLQCGVTSPRFINLLGPYLTRQEATCKRWVHYFLSLVILPPRQEAGAQAQLSQRPHGQLMYHQHEVTYWLSSAAPSQPLPACVSADSCIGTLIC